MIRIKAGVSIAALRPQMNVLLAIADAVYAHYGVDCWITSGYEGVHGSGSLHFIGLAVDLRTRDLEPGDRVEVRAEISKAAGEEFDLVLEGDHLHCEYQPKFGANQA